MAAETHSQLADFIWRICNLLRGPYKRNEYRKVILPLTVLRGFDCILAPTKAPVLKEHSAIKAKGEHFGHLRDGETRAFTEEDPITHQPVQRRRVVMLKEVTA